MIDRRSPTTANRTKRTRWRHSCSNRRWAARRTRYRRRACSRVAAGTVATWLPPVGQKTTSSMPRRPSGAGAAEDSAAGDWWWWWMWCDSTISGSPDRREPDRRRSTASAVRRCLQLDRHGDQEAAWTRVPHCDLGVPISHRNLVAAFFYRNRQLRLGADRAPIFLLTDQRRRLVTSETRATIRWEISLNCNSRHRELFNYNVIQ